MKTNKCFGSWCAQVVRYACMVLVAGVLFGCMQRQAAKSSVMTGNDRDEHGCIGTAGYTWSEVSGECIRLFEKGIRLEKIDGGGSVFIVFAADSLRAELFFSDGRRDILDRRALPGGGYAWNVEDDDTMNVTGINGMWTVSQRGKVIYTEDMPQVEERYEGKVSSKDSPDVFYNLTVKHPENSGDGTFSLTTTYPATNGNDEKSFTVSGKRYTLRGDAYDNDATVWQLVPGDGSAPLNFLVKDSATLLLLDSEFKKIYSGSITLKLKK